MNDRLDDETCNEPPRPDMLTPLTPLAREARKRLAGMDTLSAGYRLADMQMLRMDREELDRMVRRGLARMLATTIVERACIGESIGLDERRGSYPGESPFDTTFTARCVVMTCRDYEVLCELARRAAVREEE